MGAPISERLSEALAMAGMTQRQLADAIGLSEVSISRYVIGTRTPKGSTVSKMAKALHVTTDYLLGRDVINDPETEYNSVMRSVRKSSSEWSAKQKAALVCLLFGADSGS